MSDAEKRDAVLKKFYERSYKKTDGWRELDDLIMDAMADHIVELEATAERAERILVALREPSEKVVEAVAKAQEPRWWPMLSASVRALRRQSVNRILRAAVIAAEQEVGRE